MVLGTSYISVSSAYPAAKVAAGLETVPVVGPGAVMPSTPGDRFDGVVAIVGSPRNGVAPPPSTGSGATLGTVWIVLSVPPIKQLKLLVVDGPDAPPAVADPDEEGVAGPAGEAARTVAGVIANATIPMAPARMRTPLGLIPLINVGLRPVHQGPAAPELGPPTGSPRSFGPDSSVGAAEMARARTDATTLQERPATRLPSAVSDDTLTTPAPVATAPAGGDGPAPAGG